MRFGTAVILGLAAVQQAAACDHCVRIFDVIHIGNQQLMRNRTGIKLKPSRLARMLAISVLRIKRKALISVEPPRAASIMLA